MPTIHCPKCEPDNPCDGGHIYVIELGHGIEEKYHYRHGHGAFKRPDGSQYEGEWIDDEYDEYHMS